MCEWFITGSSDHRQQEGTTVTNSGLAISANTSLSEACVGWLDDAPHKINHGERGEGGPIRGPSDG